MRGELEEVGAVFGTRPAPLLLEPGLPLSYLLVREGELTLSLARYLAEARATSLRKRVPAVVEDPAGCRERLERTRTSAVFPVFASEVAFLDIAQVGALDGFVQPVEGEVAVGDVLLAPLYALAPSGERPAVTMQYWNSRWTLRSGTSPDWWRVWPQDERAAVRGDFVASMAAEAYDALGRPEYVVVENPFSPRILPGRNYLAAHARADEGMGRLAGAPEALRTVALDASCREALGILEGEFCTLHPWHAGYGSRRLRRRVVGARTLVAHVKTPARTDLEKPVCRLSAEALSAIGARAGDFVTIESVARREAEPEAWELRTVRLRALAIDEAEADARKSWERASFGEGYVDPAELHCIHPPYPSLYLNYFDRRQLDVGLAAAVLVRTNMIDRLLAEASELLWVAVAGVIFAVLLATDAPVWILVGVPVAIAVLLAFLRARRSLR